MIKTVVSIDVKEAKNIIGIYPNNIYEANTSDNPESIELDFYVPEYIIFAAFNDNSVRPIPVIDIESVSDLPIDLIGEVDSIRYSVSLNMVKAFVGTRLKFDNVVSEKEIKQQIREELQESGVKVDEATKSYLEWYENYD